MANVNITKVYLLSVPLENDYKNTLYFTSKENQKNYFLSKKKSEFDNDDFSYQRKDNVIRVKQHIDRIYNCNYVMYQNSYYSDKWFYCFIKDMRYVNDGTTEIEIETDVIQTYLFDYTIKPSFVEREHVSDDSIGLHTIPEGLETGEYISNGEVTVDMGKMYIIVGTTQAYETKVKGGLYGGCYSGVHYMCWDLEDGYEGVNYFLNYMDEGGYGDAISSIFLLPEFIVEDIKDLSGTEADHDEILIANGKKIASQTEKSVLKNTPAYDTHAELDGYFPTNNKLWTFPFNYLLLSNNTGGSTVYQYEHFKTTREGFENTCLFNMYGVACPGGSIKLVPKDYKGVTENLEESLNAGKFPICNWNTDVYTNWLTQNGTNLNISIGSSAASIAVGTGLILTGAGAGVGAGMIAGGVMGITNSLAQVKQQSLTPPQAEGNINCGDVLRGINKNTFTFLKMSIKKEYAEIIDKYFDMFGYKVNMVKVPNKAHRSRYWYTKTIDVNIDGDIPNNDIQKIKNCYNNGITFWRNASEIQNYSLSNTIV